VSLRAEVFQMSEESPDWKLHEANGLDTGAREDGMCICPSRAETRVVSEAENEDISASSSSQRNQRATGKAHY
jgi:hypothetical protein